MLLINKMYSTSKILSLALLLFLFAIPLNAQNGRFSGRIIEKGSNTPLEFVNVIIRDTETNEMKGGAVTDIDGRFDIGDLPLNRPLQATYSAMSYTTLTSPVVRLSTSKPVFDAGNVALSTEAHLLETVTITGQKRTIEYSLDRKVVNVEQTLVSEGGSAVDVLQNVPSVSVDEEGNVSMKGSDNVTILIDGRPATLSGLGLEQIASNNIANIEIISNPSVKYNPEGTSGIVNIITKERQRTGFNGNVYASGSTANRYGLGTNLSWGLKKATIFTNLDLSYRNRESSGESRRTSFRGDNPAFPEDNTQVEEGMSYREREGFGGKFQLGVDLHFDPKNSLLLSGTFNAWSNNRLNRNPENRTFSFFDANGDRHFSPMDETEHWIRSMSTYTENDDRMYDGQFALSYIHKFGKPKQDMTFDVTLDYHRPKGTSVNDRWMITPLGDGIIDSTQTIQTILNNRKGFNSDIQLNYLHPFNDKISLEVGYQGKIQWQQNVSRYDTRLNAYQDTAIDFSYLEHNHGIYANVMGTFGRFTFQVGGRMEADLMTANTVRDGGDTSFDYARFRFYPSVHMSYKIGEKQELQLSYSRRVNRPRPHNLDPYIDYSNYPSSIDYGNPDLLPQDIHSVELNYSLFLKSSSFYVTVYYRYMQDLIRRYQFEAADPASGEVLLNRTFMNYATGNTYGVDISWEQQILKWWRMSLSGSLYQNMTSDDQLDESTTVEGISYSAQFNTTMNLPLDFTLQFTCRYRGPSYWGQTRFDQNVIGEIALRKSFFKKKLNVGLRVRDLFHTQQWNSTVVGEGFTNYNKSRTKNSTALYVTLTYKFNEGVENRSQRPPHPPM